VATSRTCRRRPVWMWQRRAVRQMPRGGAFGCGFAVWSPAQPRLALAAVSTAPVRHFSNKNTPKGKRLSSDNPLYTARAPKNFVATNPLRKVRQQARSLASRCSRLSAQRCCLKLSRFSPNVFLSPIGAASKNARLLQV
jgi:hypothetical protein